MQELLERQRSQLAELEELLHQEKDALLAREVDGELLARLASSKQSLLEAIETQEHWRLAAQTKLGYAPGNREAEQAARDNGCGETWLEVQQLAQRTAYLNQLNGSLIRTRLVHNQRVLRELHQISGGTLYNADGQPNRSGARVHSSA